MTKVGRARDSSSPLTDNLYNIGVRKFCTGLYSPLFRQNTQVPPHKVRFISALNPPNIRYQLRHYGAETPASNIQPYTNLTAPSTTDLAKLQVTTFCIHINSIYENEILSSTLVPHT